MHSDQNFNGNDTIDPYQEKLYLTNPKLLQIIDDQYPIQGTKSILLCSRNIRP